MSLALSSGYGKCGCGKKTNTSSVEGSVELTHQCEICIEVR